MVYPRYKLPFDKLTTTDERIDFIHKQIDAVQIALNKLLGKEGAEPMISREVNLRVNLLPNQGQRIRKPSPLTGRILQLIPHWPDGCDALVDMAVGHKDTWIYPNEVDTFVALNDATPVLSIDEPIKQGEQLWLIGRNGDAGNSHAISCTLTIVGVGVEA